MRITQLFVRTEWELLQHVQVCVCGDEGRREEERERVCFSNMSVCDTDLHLYSIYKRVFLLLQCSTAMAVLHCHSRKQNICTLAALSGNFSFISLVCSVSHRAEQEDKIVLNSHVFTCASFNYCSEFAGSNGVTAGQHS